MFDLGCLSNEVLGEGCLFSAAIADPRGRTTQSGDQKPIENIQTPRFIGFLVVSCNLIRSLYEYI